MFIETEQNPYSYFDLDSRKDYEIGIQLIQSIDYLSSWVYPLGRWEGGEERSDVKYFFWKCNIN